MCRLNGHVPFVFTLLLTFGALAGCGEVGSTSNWPSGHNVASDDPPIESGEANSVDDPSLSNKPPKGHPREFFPADVGTTWTYNIELLGSEHPLRYELTSWPVGGDQSISYTTRGFIFNRTSLERGDDDRTFELVLAVKGPAEKQGPLSYPDGVELEIIKDELGIYGDAKQVYWAIANSGRFMANLVITYDADSPGAPTAGGFGSWGQGDGNSMRLFFFTDKPGIGISLKDSPDNLVFLGLDTDVKGFEGTECLHLKRLVEAAEAKDDEPNENPKLPESKGADRLNRAFREELWFARGKGLVRLEQYVDDASSMVWTLREFSKTPAATRALNTE